MPAVKDLTSAAQKWSRNAGAAATEFAANAQGAADKWGRNTQASGGNFRQAISAGNIQAKFERGVSKAAQLGKFAGNLPQSELVDTPKAWEGLSRTGAQDSNPITVSCRRFRFRPGLLAVTPGTMSG